MLRFKTNPPTGQPAGGWIYFWAMIIFPVIPVAGCGVYPRPKGEGIKPSPTMTKTVFCLSKGKLQAVVFRANRFVSAACFFLSDHSLVLAKASVASVGSSL